MGLEGAEERGESVKGNWMSISMVEYVGGGVVGLSCSSVAKSPGVVGLSGSSIVKSRGDSSLAGSVVVGSSVIDFFLGSQSAVLLVIDSSFISSFLLSIAVSASLEDNPSSAAVTLTESLEIENPTFEK